MRMLYQLLQRKKHFRTFVPTFNKSIWLCTAGCIIRQLCNMHVIAVVFVGHIFISLFYISTICQKDVWSFSLHIISLYSRSSLSFKRFLHFHVIYIWDHSKYQYHYCCLALHILLSCSTATNVTPLTMKALPDMRLKPRKNTDSPSLMINM